MTIQHHQALGLINWELRQQATPAASPSTWESLQHTVAQCTLCSLHKTRTQTVFGTGNHNASLMLIGEAPGFHEDQQGKPFVGAAGQLLTAMLKSIGFTRDEVYIANILKCRPPNNRNPDITEVEKCTAYLNQQIALVNPRLILALGSVASNYLLNTKSPLKSLRSQRHHYGDNKTPLIVTYHPAYLLRTPQDKKLAYADLLAAKKIISD